MKNRESFVMALHVLVAFICLEMLVSASADGSRPAQPNRPVPPGIPTENSAILAPEASARFVPEPKAPGIVLAMLDLDFRLVGTVVTDDSRENIALLQSNASGIQKAYYEGDHLGEILIKKILYGKVIISTRQGERVLFTGSREYGSEGPSLQERRLERGQIEAALPDYRRLAQSIRFRAHFEGGVPKGFVIYRIEPGSVFEDMGLENGDVILNVNHKTFATTQPVVEFYRALKEGKGISIEVKRGDSTRELQVKVL